MQLFEFQKPGLCCFFANLPPNVLTNAGGDFIIQSSFEEGSHDHEAVHREKVHGYGDAPDVHVRRRLVVLF